MKTLLLKTLINFAMIQTALLATSLGVSAHLPMANSVIEIFAFVYVVSFLFTFLPSLGVSFAFALFQSK